MVRNCRAGRHNGRASRVGGASATTIYMATSSTIDLSQLPAPEGVETLDFEAILAEYVAIATPLIDFNPNFPGDPVTKILSALAYREVYWRTRVNEAVKAVMVAYAIKGDLDNLGALMGVARPVVTPADATAGTAAVMLDDESYRALIVQAPQGYSVAGPEGAYIFHALAASTDVQDVSVNAPQPDDIKALVMGVLAAHGADAALTAAMQTTLDEAVWPGTVEVCVLSKQGDGTAPETLLDTVDAALSSDDVRPLTDYVKVKSAEILNYGIDAELTFFDGPDRAVVLAKALQQLEDYKAASRRLGRDIVRAAIITALCPKGVQNVKLNSPPEDIPVNQQQAGNCTGSTVANMGVGE
ncbi:baseplate J/gp47 family protein [Novosphingobium sp.]|uniref:baseplate assembly protein n=1 Tax=Novosphingobium sp. TaxID=1874826 RepID=UPI0031D77797